MNRQDFRARVAARRPLLCPGFYDALSAALVEQAGFEAAYLSGASIAYIRLGAPDIGLVSLAAVWPNPHIRGQLSDPTRNPRVRAHQHVSPERGPAAGRGRAGGGGD